MTTQAGWRDVNHQPSAPGSSPTYLNYAARVPRCYLHNDYSSAHPCPAYGVLWSPALAWFLSAYGYRRHKEIGVARCSW